MASTSDMSYLLAILAEWDQGCHASGRPRQCPQDVRTRPTNPRTSAGRHAVRHSTRRTAWRTAIRPPDGMPSATPPGGRHGGQPPNRWSPAPTVGWMADGRSVRRSGWWSAGWRTAGRTAWQTPPPGPSARGCPPGTVRQGPSSRGRPPEAVRHGPSARAVRPAKTLESITIDLEFRFKRVIPFWNVQVMLYNMGY
jgi:hypothetical protein